MTIEKLKRVFDLRNGLLIEYSAFLWIGMFLALLAANLFSEWYRNFVSDGILFVVNEYGMAYFFARAMKEVWEAIRDPEGALSSLKTAATPLLATVGGWVTPFALAFVISKLLGFENPLQIGVVVTATDIVFSRVFLQIAVGRLRPVLTFVTTLALVDDGIGLVAIAALFHHGELHIEYLVLLTGGAMAAAFIANRYMHIRSHWVYFALMNISWAGMYLGGLPPALAFAIIIPFMPNTYSQNGNSTEKHDSLFGRDEESRHDTLDEWAEAWHSPIEIFLLLFAFVNIGVTFREVHMGPLFFLITGSILIGKTAGVYIFTSIGLYLGLELPGGMTRRHLLLTSLATSIGMTVMAFVGRLAFHTPDEFSQVILAALASLGIAGTILSAYGLLSDRSDEVSKVQEEAIHM